MVIVWFCNFKRQNSNLIRENCDMTISVIVIILVRKLSLY